MDDELDEVFQELRLNRALSWLRFGNERSSPQRVSIWRCLVVQWPDRLGFRLWSRTRSSEGPGGASCAFRRVSQKPWSSPADFRPKMLQIRGAGQDEAGVPDRSVSGTVLEHFRTTSSCG